MKQLYFLVLLLASAIAFGQVPSHDISPADSATFKVKLDTANFLISKYQYQQALPYLIVCHNEEPNNIDILKKSGYCSYKLGRWKEACDYYRKAMKANPEDEATLHQLGAVSMKISDYNEAVKYYEKLIKIDSTNSYYYKLLAKTSIKTGAVGNAIGYYQKSLSLNSNDIESITELSKLYFNLLSTAADSLIHEGLQLDSTNRNLLLLQAKSSYRQQNYASVTNAVQKLLEKGDTAAFYAKLMGVSFYHLSNFKQAIYWLEYAAKLPDPSDVIHYYLGLSYKKINDPEKAAYHFQNAIKKSISENISHYYTQLAITYEENYDYPGAIKYYKAAYNASRNKGLLYHLARNYDNYYKDKETALAYYEKYLEENDTANSDFQNYSEHRVSELKEIIHFGIDSLD